MIVSVQGAESDSSSRLLRAAPALFIGGNKISAVVSALGRFRTLNPNLKLTFLTATFRSKPDITIRYVKVQINGDFRP